ncbi:MAG: hypothetical protein ACTHPS_07490 [Streptosporangiaceae bacterium]
MTHDQRSAGWTAVLRRQPACVVDGRPEGGYTDAFEIICSECGDDPGLDYHEVSPELQQTRGPYPIRVGFAAYVRHLALHPQPPATPVGRE